MSSSAISSQLLDNVLDTLRDQFQVVKQRQLTSEVSTAVVKSQLVGSVIEEITAYHLDAEDEKHTLISMGITIGLAMSEFVDFEKVKPS